MKPTFMVEEAIEAASEQLLNVRVEHRRYACSDKSSGEEWNF